MNDEPEEIVWQGRFITTKTRGKWEYVARARGIKAAVIIAVDEGHILLVEQFRVPLGRPCLEFPAGLIGDDEAGEAVEAAAIRELEEETGFRAGRIELLGEFHSSPGMVSESFHLVRAHDLRRTGPGGGVDSENILVHRVPLSDAAHYVRTRQREGCAVDAKLLVLLLGGQLG